MLTRCTHCDTAFRITPEDLALARGRVRCGQCMRTFDALQKLTDEKEQQQLGYGVEYSGESKDIGQPQNIVEPEDIGEPQHAAEPEDIGEPQHAAEPEDIGEPEDVAQLEDVDKTNHTAQSVAGDAWITDDTLEHGKVDADVMELHGLSYGDLDEELLNTHTDQ